MKNKKPIILLASIGVILVFTVGLLWSNASSRPSVPNDNPYDCHSVGSYSISANRSGIIPIVQEGGSIDVEFTGSGPNVVLQIIPGARDNTLLFGSSDINVTDGGPDDLDGSVNNAIRTVITISIPAGDRNYEIMVIARDSLTAYMPDFAYKALEFQVGAGPSVWDQIVKFFETYVFTHKELYLGGAAIISLGIGTLLYEYGRSGKGSLASSKYVKAHGLLAGTSLILTTINVYFIVNDTGSALTRMFDPTRIISWSSGEIFHFLHIAFGITGFVFGIIAMLTGLAGIRTRIPGYLTLLFWGFNFIHGLLIWQGVVSIV